MSLEIPPLETDQEVLNSKIYDRAIKILEYQNTNPDKDWKDNPELVYIDLQDSGEEYMVKKIDLENNGDDGGLYATLFYIPSCIPLKQLKEIPLADCELYSFRIYNEEKEKKIRDLRSPITITTYKYIHPDPEKVKEILEDFSKWQEKQREERKRKSFSAKLRKQK